MLVRPPRFQLGIPVHPILRHFLVSARSFVILRPLDTQPTKAECRRKQWMTGGNVEKRKIVKSSANIHIWRVRREFVMILNSLAIVENSTALRWLQLRCTISRDKHLSRAASLAPRLEIKLNSKLITLAFPRREN